jgi:hypothetical protein
MKRLAFWIIAIIPGEFSALISGYYVLVDWALLRQAYAKWSAVVARGGDQRELFIAATAQDILRVNVFTTDSTPSPSS